jgi:hypothetical protein
MVFFCMDAGIIKDFARSPCFFGHTTPISYGYVLPFESYAGQLEGFNRLLHGADFMGFRADQPNSDHGIRCLYANCFDMVLILVRRRFTSVICFSYRASCERTGVTGCLGLVPTFLTKAPSRLRNNPKQ